MKTIIEIKYDFEAQLFSTEIAMVTITAKSLQELMRKIDGNIHNIIEHPAGTIL